GGKVGGAGEARGGDRAGAFGGARLSLSDSTIERLAVLLEARPQGLAFVADELARLFLNMRRYSNGQDNEFWLEAWNGKNFVVERQGRPPVVVVYLLVGVIGLSDLPGSAKAGLGRPGTGMGRQGRHPCPETERRTGLPGLGHARRARTAVRRS